MIRKFEDGDAARCSEIMIACIEKNLGYTGSNKDFMIKMSSSESVLKKAGEVDFFVFVLNGDVIGTGVLDKNEVRTMFFDPTFQRRGYGGEMLSFLINLAKERRCDSVFLGASPEAEGFYEKFGFKAVSETKDRIDYELILQ